MAQLHLRIPSHLDHVSDAVQQIMDMARKHTPQLDFFGLELISRELIVNGIVHGNKKQSEHQVDILATPRDHALELTVTDEGAGFNWRKAMDADLPAPDDPRGRGIHLLKAYCREVSFNDNGNQVQVLLAEEAAE